MVVLNRSLSLMATTPAASKDASGAKLKWAPVPKAEPNGELKKQRPAQKPQARQTKGKNSRASSSDGEAATCPCGVVFVWTIGEQAFYAKKGLSRPTYCPKCRAEMKKLNKAKRASRRADPLAQGVRDSMQQLAGEKDAYVEMKREAHQLLSDLKPPSVVATAIATSNAVPTSDKMVAPQMRLPTYLEERNYRWSDRTIGAVADHVSRKRTRSLPARRSRGVVVVRRSSSLGRASRSAPDEVVVKFTDDLKQVQDEVDSVRKNRFRWLVPIQFPTFKFPTRAAIIGGVVGAAVGLCSAFFTDNPLVISACVGAGGAAGVVSTVAVHSLHQSVTAEQVSVVPLDDDLKIDIRHVGQLQAPMRACSADCAVVTTTSVLTDSLGLEPISYTVSATLLSVAASQYSESVVPPADMVAGFLARQAAINAVNCPFSICGVHYLHVSELMHNSARYFEYFKQRRQDFHESQGATDRLYSCLVMKWGMYLSSC
jgi:hypothetical protein